MYLNKPISKDKRTDKARKCANKGITAMEVGAALHKFTVQPTRGGDRPILEHSSRTLCFNVTNIFRDFMSVRATCGIISTYKSKEMFL